MQAMVLALLLALLVASMIRVSLQRHTLVHKANSAAAMRLRAFGADSWLRSCLAATEFGKTTCSLPAGSNCVPPSTDGKRVSVRTRGTPPDCTLTVEVED